MVADLHLHTTASDGTYSPKEIVKRAKELGFKAIAITDHDTIEGILPAKEEGVKFGLEVIAGIELNTDYNGIEIHMLGYLFDMKNKKFRETLEQLIKARSQRVVGIVEKLQNIGLDIQLDRVKELAGQGAIGRPHVARALMEKGFVYNIREAFDKYIGFRGPAYVSRFKISPMEAIRMIREAKGIPVLAHPGLINRDELIHSLSKEGLMGLEAYHSDHSPAKGSYYAKLAQKHGLLITGGSDCHGPAFKNGDLIGKIRLPYSHVERLKEAKQVTFGG